MSYLPSVCLCHFLDLPISPPPPLFVQFDLILYCWYASTLSPLFVHVGNHLQFALSLSVDVRRLQVAILARSPREMSQTDIVWQYILSRGRISVRPSIFLYVKNIHKLSRMPSLAYMAVEWTSHTDNNAVTVESLATRRSRNNCGHTAKNQRVKTATVRVYTVTA